jgi:serine protease AprX
MSRTLFTALLATLLLTTHATAAERIVQFDPAWTTRAQLQRDLAGLGVQSAPLKKLPFAIARGDARQLARLRALPAVVRTWPNERLVYELDESANLVYGGAAARQSTYRAGFDGSGQTIATIDTGVDALHPDFAGRVVKNVKVVGGDGALDDAGAPPTFHHFVECPVPCDTDTTSGHGTHVASIAAGSGAASDGRYQGIAPGAGIVALSVGDAVAIFHALQAYDYLLAHPELHVVAVNNSYGPSGGGRFDARSPIAIGTKRLHDAGIAVVFSGGNSGTGSAHSADPNEPEGSSNCAPDAPPNPVPPVDGDPCRSNPNGLAPWAISVGAVRKDHPGGIGDQPLTFFSARGDDDPQRSLDGAYTIRYGPTLVAPGMNIRAARAVTGAAVGTQCAGNDPIECIPDAPQYEAYYAPSSGTSMAAPHVTGAIAVLQDAADSRLGRRLTPDEVKQVLVATAAPMTKVDALWDFPCGNAFLACGGPFPGTTGKPYEPWQVGAGALDLREAVSAVLSTPPGKKPKKPRKRISP